MHVSTGHPKRHEVPLGHVLTAKGKVVFPLICGREGKTGHFGFQGSIFIQEGCDIANN